VEPFDVVEDVVEYVVEDVVEDVGSCFCSGVIFAVG
jgi:hypothetical protein